MTKFNKPGARTRAGTGVIKTTGNLGDAITYEGAAAYSRDNRSELFMLAVVNMVGEDTFYEGANERDERYRQLVQKVAVDHPVWTYQFLRWLRSSANMRSASVVGAAEAVRAWTQEMKRNGEYEWYLGGLSGHLGGGNARFDGVGIGRRTVNAVLQRADEPGELIAYWRGRYGRSVPSVIKRGISDAMKRGLVNEYTALKYDTESKGYRFGDVIDVVHPKPFDPRQSTLFRYLLDKRHNRADALTDPVVEARLRMTVDNQIIRKRLATAEDPVTVVQNLVLRNTGLTWEDVLSLLGNRTDKARLWERLIEDGAMGYMALLRNLRNFDEAGISNDAARKVMDTLRDQRAVERSRQFPYRFLSAYKAVNSVRWAPSLEEGLQHSLQNVPSFGGRTLVLVDTSGSMEMRRSARSDMTNVEVGALFGVALAAKGENVDLHGFAGGGSGRKVTFHHKVAKGASVLRETERFCKRIGEVGHGTMIGAAVQQTYRRGEHDRIIIVSDMQTFGPTYAYGDVVASTAAPTDVPMYGFNLGGYRPTVIDTSQPNRYEMGGMTDATFRQIPMIEAGVNEKWPWEVQ